MAQVNIRILRLQSSLKAWFSDATVSAIVLPLQIEELKSAGYGASSTSVEMLRAFVSFQNNRISFIPD